MRAALPLILFAVLSGCRTAPSDAAPPSRPHIVLILADDLGWGDVGAFGGDLSTPHIDSLARDGATLTNWYAAAPVCTPSRYALLTGRHPQRSLGGLDGVIMMLADPEPPPGLHPSERTIAELLHEAGYATALSGKWHMGHAAPELLPTRHGFEQFYGALGGCVDYFEHGYGYRHDWFEGEEPADVQGYATDLIAANAARVVEQRDADRPLFLVVSFTAPHYGKSVEDEVAGEEHTLVTRAFGRPRLDPETGRTVQVVNTLQAKPADLALCGRIGDEKRQYYAAMVKGLDDGVGTVLAALDRAGISDNTLVFFMADNGPDETPSSAGSSGPLRGGKHDLYEGGIRVPCLARWPRRIAAGAEIDQVGGGLDLMPTFGALAGADTTGLALDGTDLTQTWIGNARYGREMYWRHGRTSAIRGGRWKLVGDELYDLEADMGETTNLAGQYPQIAKKWLERRNGYELVLERRR